MRYFSGICRDGPYDNLSLIHYFPKYRVAHPPAKFVLPDTAPQLVNVRIGCYLYIAGQWIWHEDEYADR